MPFFIKKFLRKLSLRFEYATAHWVVPEYVCRDLDDEKYEEVTSFLEKATSKWGSDPEIIRVAGLTHFLLGESSDDPADVARN